MATASKTWGELESAAIEAHTAGTSWSRFWLDVAGDVAALHPHDREQFRRAYQRLMHLWATGDSAGQEPPGSAPWEWDSATEAAT
jgi:hypothetical protein